LNLNEFCSEERDSNFSRRRLIMGLTVLELEVGNPANPEVTEKLEFLIDSSAIYSV
jgi:hypothetical protein